MKNDDTTLYVKETVAYGPIKRRYTMENGKIIKLETICKDGSIRDFDDPEVWLGDDDWRNHIVYDYKNKNICGNCSRHLTKKDKYCPYCGTKKGEGNFLPFLSNDGLLVYGPPTSHYYKCKKCGFKWRESSLGGIVGDNYCPRCGTKHIINTYNAEDVGFFMDCVIDKSCFTFKDHLKLLLLKVKIIIENKFKLMKYCK